MATINVDIIVAFFLVILIYYLLLYILSLRTPKYTTKNLKDWALIVFIPAHNEELVIKKTVLKALNLIGSVHVIVIEDGSTDSTHKILQDIDNSRLHILKRDYPEAKIGKGEALNHAFRYLCNNRLRWMPKSSIDKTIVTVVDADGYLDKSLLLHVAAMLENKKNLVGIQVPVSIQEPESSLMLRFQDIEFVGFSCFVQRARHWVSSVGLGGNGQFVRLSALHSLGSKPWNKALSEDLDIGLRLLINGYRLGFCNEGFVHQQGLKELKPLIKQRTRWVHGHYQAWQYIPKLWFSKASILTKIDTTLYLLLVLSVWVVLVNTVINILSLSGFIATQSYIFDFINSSSPLLARIFLLLLSIGPVLLFIFAYLNYSHNKKLPILYWPATMFLFSLYSWVWVFASINTVVRIVSGNKEWAKTKRHKLTSDTI